MMASEAIILANIFAASGSMEMEVAISSDLYKRNLRV